MLKIAQMIIVTMFLLASGSGWAVAHQIKSPDGKIEVSLNDEGGAIKYALNYNGEEIIHASDLGIEFKNVDGFVSDLVISKVRTNSADNAWEQPWGEQRIMRDHHNALVATVTGIHDKNKIMRVHIKVFDDGIGFRYEVDKVGEATTLEIIDEKTTFVIAKPEKSTAWWIPGRGWNRYEYHYNTSSLSTFDRVHTPLTFRLENGVHVSIHEAALTDYAAMVLDQQRDGVLKADLTPWSDGIRVKTAPGFRTPWRTLQIAPEAKGLINSSLILNLNEPNKLGDVSWVEPSKYVGVWWDMHVNAKTWGSGDKHGANNAHVKRYIDFAAEHGFKGVLVEGWNEGWDGSWYHNGDVFRFTQSYPDFDLPMLAKYAIDKGVRLVGHHETSGAVTNYKNQMQAAFDLYQKNGVTQVKTGYVADGGKIKRIDEHGIVRHEWHDGQFTVAEYLRSVTEAAKRKISINTHEPIKDTGLRRTYPNWIAREGARGQEYNAWGSPPNYPEHTAILPFTRLLSGPMDYTPGVFNLAPYGLEAENRVRSTLAKELALYVVIYSPIQMAADQIENYFEADGKTLRKGFQFIKDVPTDWEQSIALQGEVGEFVVIARKERKGDDWYLGALTDENARHLKIPLEFLDRNAKYHAQIYRDGKSANWQTNPYALDVEMREVTHETVLDLALATSGGAAIRFKRIK